MIGIGNKIHHTVFIGPNVVIGDYCNIQAMTFIPDNVIIKSNVFIGPGVIFCNDKYPPSKGKWKDTEPTIVEDGVSIGANATILPSLTLGKGCRVGAGAVVTKDIPPNTLVKGNPAK